MEKKDTNAAEKKNTCTEAKQDQVLNFNNLFSDYKIKLKMIKRTIDWSDLPLYRKICIILLLSLAVGFVVFFIVSLATWKDSRSSVVSIIGYTVFLVCIIILFIVYFRIDEKHLPEMLEKFYKKSAGIRTGMLIDLLQSKDYNLDITNERLLDYLIEEAKDEKKANDPFSGLFSYFVKSSAVTIPVALAVMNALIKNLSPEVLLGYSLYAGLCIISIIGLCMFLFPAFRSLIYYDEGKYNDLIFDLRQIRIFYIFRKKLE